jgi:hypothetical protein
MQQHRDAVAFYALALQDQQQEDEVAAQRTGPRYVRASVIAAFACLEAQLNMAASGHTTAHREALDGITLDVLLERETMLDEQGRIQDRKRRIPLTARLSFLTAFLSVAVRPERATLGRSSSCDRTPRRLRAPKAAVPVPRGLHSPVDTVVGVLSEVHRLMGIDPLPWWRPTEELLREDDPL